MTPISHGRQGASATVNLLPGVNANLLSTDGHTSGIIFTATNRCVWLRAIKTVAPCGHSHLPAGLERSKDHAPEVWRQSGRAATDELRHCKQHGSWLGRMCDASDASRAQLPAQWPFSPTAPSPISTTIVCIGLWCCCVPHNSGALSTANNYAWLRFCSVPHNGYALFHYKQLRPAEVLQCSAPLKRQQLRQQLRPAAAL